MNDQECGTILQAGFDALLIEPIAWHSLFSALEAEHGAHDRKEQR
jgi:preprotein translocase subunit SecB